MRTRLLGMTLLATLGIDYSQAVVVTPVHPYADQMLALTLPERTLVTGYLNSSPVLGAPRIGENSKEVIVQVEKIAAFTEGRTTPILTTTCTTTITNLHTIINVSGSDIYVHRTQSIKMSPLGCALEEDGSIKAEGVFPDGIKSEVKKISGFFPELAAILSQWDTWTISGKNLKYTWEEESPEGSEYYYLSKDSGTVNLGATSILCSDNSVFTNYSEVATTSDAGDPITLKINYKQTSTKTCAAPKAVLGKVNADLMSITLDEYTQYCAEGIDAEICGDPVELGFPEQLLPSFPSDSAQ